MVFNEKKINVTIDTISGRLKLMLVLPRIVAKTTEPSHTAIKTKDRLVLECTNLYANGFFTAYNRSRAIATWLNICTRDIAMPIESIVALDALVQSVWRIERKLAKDRHEIVKDSKQSIHPKFVTNLCMGPLSFFVRYTAIIMTILLITASNDTIAVGSLQRFHSMLKFCSTDFRALSIPLSL